MDDSEDSSKMPCFGEYLAGNYACEYSCLFGESCPVVTELPDKSLAELPKFIVHPNRHVRKYVSNLVEQLGKK